MRAGDVRRQGTQGENRGMAAGSKIHRNRARERRDQVAVVGLTAREIDIS
jgi:hypothetical protein